MDQRPRREPDTRRDTQASGQILNWATFGSNVTAISGAGRGNIITSTSSPRGRRTQLLQQVLLGRLRSMVSVAGLNTTGQRVSIWTCQSIDLSWATLVYFQ
jgi:hypothetical protein